MPGADELQANVESRLRELKPMVDEYERLLRVAEAFRGTEQAPPSPSRVRSGHSRSRVGRGPSGGRRADQILALVTSRPGITVAEVAAELGIGTTYLYRLLPQLEQQGKVVKRDQGYHPRA